MAIQGKVVETVVSICYGLSRTVVQQLATFQPT